MQGARAAFLILQVALASSQLHCRNADAAPDVATRSPALLVEPAGRETESIAAEKPTGPGAAAGTAQDLTQRRPDGEDLQLPPLDVDARSKKRHRFSAASTTFRAVRRVVLVSLVLYLAITWGFAKVRKCLSSRRGRSDGSAARRLMDDGNTPSSSSSGASGPTSPTCEAVLESLGAAAGALAPSGLSRSYSEGHRTSSSSSALPGPSTAPSTSLDPMEQLTSSMSSMTVEMDPLQRISRKWKTLRQERGNLQHKRKAIQRELARAKAEAAGTEDVQRLAALAADIEKEAKLVSSQLFHTRLTASLLRVQIERNRRTHRDEQLSRRRRLRPDSSPSRPVASTASPPPPSPSTSDDDMDETG
ncbi:hypothetical protein BESB_008200 [Besnoitia besnoiti]|uniref:Transmembrane protein n=1 Tax=Besnoitia besnoiti TaxID=94643 RepID=A0A2A9MIW1_BESBE|nr:hypothetical protein BESB_008200 [Besnoitia besnoiti]PFH38478.1 hypothetical protein BESB_008200 [Besnoitia besnoiti]